jgi:hypothetical protein
MRKMDFWPRDSVCSSLPGGPLRLGVALSPVSGEFLVQAAYSSYPVSAISTATPINGIDSAGIAAMLSENGVFPKETPSKPRKPRFIGSLPIYLFFNITLERFDYLSG